ncbi:hypothetical protein LCGC14_0264990 [marine sediment metagenome]|uniref:Thymidylate kinase-like domain-containing protein n=1 Tax=marine sediment metagenome TaxID=412755 RepID=A0A0F9WLL8_9ZZZZ
MKPKFIILEGISGAGKTALLHPVGKLSNYADLSVARFTPSCWVYNQLYSRTNVDYEVMNRAIMVEHDVHVVWLRCSSETALERCRLKDDDNVEDLSRADYLFGQYFTRYTAIQQIHIVNTEQHINDSIAEIRDKVYGSY